MCQLNSLKSSTTQKKFFHFIHRIKTFCVCERKFRNFTQTNLFSRSNNNFSMILKTITKHKFAFISFLTVRVLMSKKESDEIGLNQDLLELVNGYFYASRLHITQKSKFNMVISTFISSHVVEFAQFVL